MSVRGTAPRNCARHIYFHCCTVSIFNQFRIQIFFTRESFISENRVFLLHQRLDIIQPIYSISTRRFPEKNTTVREWSLDDILKFTTISLRILVRLLLVNRGKSINWEKISIHNSRRKLRIPTCRASSALSNVISHSSLEFCVAEKSARTFDLFLITFRGNTSWSWLKISSISTCIREARPTFEISNQRCLKRDVDELPSSYRWKDTEKTLMSYRSKIDWHASRHTASRRISAFS